MDPVQLPEVDDIARHFRRALLDSIRCEKPYRHWRLEEVLPREVCLAIISLPIAPLLIDDCKGVRDVDNSLRTFLTPAEQTRFPVFDRLVQALMRPEVGRLLAKTCEFQAEGSFLRAEYIQDIDGAWLEAHHDVPAKLFSMVIYLFTGPDTKEWGTDIYDTDRKPIGKSTSAFNSGTIFIPGPTTWHGFDKRKIVGIRRLMEINYVHPSWRDRDQLACPERPVRLESPG